LQQASHEPFQPTFLRRRNPPLAGEREKGEKWSADVTSLHCPPRKLLNYCIQLINIVCIFGAFAATTNLSLETQTLCLLIAVEFVAQFLNGLPWTLVIV
jgi:hypothetical protein